MTKNEKFLTGLIAGALVGSSVAMLLTPKPGKDTRKVVGGRTNTAARQAAYYIGTVRNRIMKDPDDVLIGSHSENGTG